MTLAARAQVAADAKKAAAEAAAKDPTKFGSKKSKATAKQGAAKYTWDILASTGVPVADIPKFRCCCSQQKYLSHISV